MDDRRTTTCRLRGPLLPGQGRRRVPALPLSAVLLLSALLWAGCPLLHSATSGDAADRSAQTAADTLSLDALADTLPPAEAARYAFRGRDLEGKDGPLAKIGYDLAHVYFAYRAHREQRQTPAGSPAFEPPGGARVTEGRVLIDATASQSGDRLKADLDALGLAGGTAAGPVVSGRLPIGALPEAARLGSLRSMRPSRPASYR